MVNRDKLNSWYKPKSVCSCGHTGDGHNSEHRNTSRTPGHGGCQISGCNCRQFTWVAWTPEAKAVLELK